jgi:excisionase family DNA binding protein
MTSNIRVKRVCTFCGIEFIAKTTTTRFCGQACSGRMQKEKARLLKIEQSQAETDSLRKADTPIQRSQNLVKARSAPQKTIQLNFEEVNKKEHLTTQEALLLLGIGRTTLHEIVKRGDVPLYKIGRKSFFKKSELLLLFKKPEIKSDILPLDFKKEDYFTINEVMTLFSWSTNSLKAFIKRFNIPKFKHSRFTYVPKDKILAMKKEILNKDELT